MKAETTVIKVSSRASVKIKESFYTVEYGEERSIQGPATEAELDEERAALWDKCNSEVDNQIQDIVSTFLK